MNRLNTSRSAPTALRRRRLTPAASIVAALLAASVIAVTPLITTTADAIPINLLNRNQQSFEADPIGWEPNTVARVWRTRQTSADGKYSLLVAAIASKYDGTKPMHVNTLPGTSGAKVTPGVEYTGQFKVRPWKTFTDDVACEVVWSRLDGSLISVSRGPWQPETADAWKSISCTAVAPSGAAFAALRVRFHSVYQGDVHYIDQAGLIEPSTTPHQVLAPLEDNLLESEQHSFEAALDGWVSQGNAALSRSMTASKDGSASMMIVGSRNDAVYVDESRTIRAATMPGTDGVRAIVGHTYEGRIYVMSPNESSPARC